MSAVRALTPLRPAQREEQPEIKLSKTPGVFVRPPNGICSLATTYFRLRVSGLPAHFERPDKLSLVESSVGNLACAT